METIESIESHPQYVALQQELLSVKEELAQLKRLIFGRRSEKLAGLPGIDQPTLFEQQAAVAVELEQQVGAHSRRVPAAKQQPVRLALPAHLPRIEEVIEPQDKPSEARRIGEEVTELLAYQPASLYVRRIVRPKYVDATAQSDGVFTAPMPSLALPRSKADSSLLSQMLISKYVDHLPLYRQAQQYARQGVELAASTMGDWFMATCGLLGPLYDALKALLLSDGYIQADETPIKVQIKGKQGKLHQGYFWVYGDPVRGLACFDYRKSRSREGPKDFLKDYRGLLQADGYTAYEDFDGAEGITLLGCMAHVRRKFVEALDNDRPRSEEVIRRIGQLYAWEEMYREQGYAAEDILRHRQEHHVEKLEEIAAYCQEELVKVSPKSSLGKAMGYLLRQWPKVARYTDHGQAHIDNNRIENTIRPVALGRKNYLFAGSHQAAQQAATIYSLLATCKLQGIEPYSWLKDCLDKLPDYPVNRVAELLPIQHGEKGV